MRMIVKRSGKSQIEVRIALRVPVATLSLIDQAAALKGQSRSEFILESIRPHAIDAIMDQRVFKLNKEQSGALIDVVMKPPRANQTLKALMRKTPIWK